MKQLVASKFTSFSSLSSITSLFERKKDATFNRHYIPIEELCEELKTDPVSGLTHLTAKETLEHLGPNILTFRTRKSAIVNYIKQTFTGFSLMIWIASLLMLTCAILNFLIYDLIIHDQFVLSIGLMVLEIIGNTFEYYIVIKSEKLLISLRNILPQTATIIREGKEIVILTKDLAEGDLVSLSTGMVVPGDVRIIDCNGLKADRSTITGEKDSGVLTTTSNSEELLKSTNVAFFTTTVTEGTGLGIVIATGTRSVVGRIAKLAASVKPTTTSLSNDISHFIKVVSFWALFTGITCGLIYYFTTGILINTLILMTDVIMSNVPGAFTQSIKTSLILSSKRMSVRKCVVRNPESLVSLGAATVICTGKTGTITKNFMHVSAIWFNGLLKSIGENEQSYDDVKFKVGYKELLRCALLSNQPSTSKNKAIMTMDEATLQYILKSKMFRDNYRNENLKVFSVPFSSEFQYQLSINILKESGKFLISMKGAPERILHRCTRMFYNNKTVALSAALMELCEEMSSTLAKDAEKVMGFCDLILEPKEYPKNYKFSMYPFNFPRSKMRFLGFIAYADPLRLGVVEAVEKSKKAGIRVTLITGDHLNTAKKIAQQVGILTAKKVHTCSFVDEIPYFSTYARMSLTTSLEMMNFVFKDGLVVHGDIIRDVPSYDLDRLLKQYKEIIFANITPSQKLKIVESYQRLGEVVVVTGDGLNDTPALKRADVGIAMGIAGSEVTHNASDIILMDDNFASIIEGVMEGRKLFDNLKKAITFKCSSNIAQIIPGLLSVFLGIPQMIGVQNILFIDLISDSIPTISLIFEQAESDIMLRPPRNSTRDKLISRKLFFLAYGHIGIIETMAGTYAYFLIMAEFGFLPENLINIRIAWENNGTIINSFGKPWEQHERQMIQLCGTTGYMVALIVMQFANVICCRTRLKSTFQQKMRNMTLNISFIAIVIFVSITVSIPNIFDHGDYINYKMSYSYKFMPLQLRWYFYALPFAIYLILFDEFRKWHIRNNPKGWFQRETFY